MVNKEKIIFGTWPISGDFTQKYELEKGLSLINYALEKGIYCFDTAPNYGNGNAEKLLGTFIKDCPKKEITITTKIGNSSKDVKSFDYDDILAEMDNSIKRLNRIPDRLLFHNPRIEEEELLNLHEKLKIKLSGIKVGISLARFNKYSEDFLSQFPIIQYDHNIFYSELNGKKFSAEIEARSIFASGILTNKFVKNNINNMNFKFPKNDKRSSWFIPPRSNMISAITTMMDHLISSNYSKYSIEKAAFKYVENCNPNKMVIGFSNSRHIDNVLDWLECSRMCGNLFRNLELIKSSKIKLW